MCAARQQWKFHSAATLTTWVRHTHIPAPPPHTQGVWTERMEGARKHHALLDAILVAASVCLSMGLCVCLPVQL